MSDIFYSESDGLLFWVAGYTRDTNTSNVLEMIADLKSNAQEFASFAGVPIDYVKTHFVEKSQRYKYMRVFYANVPPEKAPETAYALGKDWTMWAWLEN